MVVGNVMRSNQKVKMKEVERRWHCYGVLWWNRVRMCWLNQSKWAKRLGLLSIWRVCQGVSSMVCGCMHTGTFAKKSSNTIFTSYLATSTLLRFYAWMVDFILYRNAKLMWHRRDATARRCEIVPRHFIVGKGEKVTFIWNTHLRLIIIFVFIYPFQHFLVDTFVFLFVFCFHLSIRRIPLISQPQFDWLISRPLPLWIFTPVEKTA